VAEHEAVACPCAEYGREYKGTRADCKKHEQTECAFGRVSTFVQDVRNMRAEYGNRFRNVVHRLRAVRGWFGGRACAAGASQQCAKESVESVGSRGLCDCQLLRERFCDGKNLLILLD
jgi:hypothetical protein